MSIYKEKEKSGEEEIRTQADRIIWERQTRDERNVWIPRSFIALGPFGQRRYTLREPVYPVKALAKQLEGVVEEPLGTGLEEETWLGVIGRGRRRQRQWYTILRGQPQAQTLCVIFSPGGEIEKEMEMLSREFRQLTGDEERTAFLKERFGLIE